MKKGKWLWIGLGVLVVLLITVVNVVRQVQGKVTPVQFARVRIEDITSQVRAPGKIEAKTAGQDQRRSSRQGRRTCW